jgi:hypothetical protein
MLRTILPELLDTLPPDHPDAQHSRRDLRIINRIMGNHRWIKRVLPALVRQNEHVLEIGAGTGELARALAQTGLSIAGLDYVPPPETWPSSLSWHSANLTQFRSYGDYPVLLGNLIFHQFTGPELAALGELIRPTTRVIVACEPARSSRSDTFFRLLAPCFGANPVTLHDAPISIKAGFLGHELPHALGLDQAGWDINCSATALGAYRMIARRRQ